MAHKIDYGTASCAQIEKDICSRLEQIRLARNITQAEIAREAGVSRRTIGRMEKGEGTSLDSFIRVLTALRLQQNLTLLLPDPDIRPIELISDREGHRRRARSKTGDKESRKWTWGDEEHG
ncbi:helix-turn-helix domain-containing protein [Spirochaeta dissipatitropha]